MASFTDQIPKFNPYVQQLPVEAMVSVGMEKQRRYDEGVQKIQTSIDNIAGLDIGNDADKVYLQSALNQLGSNLKTVAAGDFSNYQLVNSVSGMTSQIIKDPVIQTAVSSTAWYRKQSQDMEKAISEGKASQANIDDFNEKASAWFNSKTPGQSFRDRYTPYIDVKKKVLDVIKELHPEIQKYDIPFEVDANGKMTQKTADAMQRYKIEGIDEARIQQAIVASLTPEEMNQLSIDARYQFKGVDSEQLVGIAKKNYDKQRTETIAELGNLRDQRRITSDPTKLGEIENRISQYERALGLDGKRGTLDEQLLENVDNARTNPNQVKFNIYKDGFVKQFSNAFKWKSQEMEYVTSPLTQQLNWVAEMDLNQKKYNRGIYEFDETLALRKEEVNLKKEENKLKGIELGLPEYGVAGGGADQEALETTIQEKSDEIYVDHAKSVAANIQSQNQLLLDKGYNQNEINVMMNSWEKAQGVASKANIMPDAIGPIQQMARQNNYLKSLEKLQDNLKVEANDEVKNSPQYKGFIAQQKADLSKINSGKPIVISYYDNATKSMKKFSRTADQLIKDINAGNAEIRTDNSKNFLMELTYKTSGGDVKVSMRKDKGSSIGTQVIGADQMRGPLSDIVTYLRKSNKKETELQNAIDAKYKEKLAPIARKLVPTLTPVQANKTGEVPAPILVNLSKLVTLAGQKQIATDSKFDVETASGFLLEKNRKDTQVFVRQSGDGMYEVILKNGADPENLQRLKLTADQVRRNIGAAYLTNNTQESMRVAIGRGDTNLNKDPMRSVLQKQFGDFSQIQNLQITADLREYADKPGNFYPIINLKKKDGKYVSFVLAGMNKNLSVGYQQGVDNLNALDDTTLIKRLKQEYPNFDYSSLDY
jgi:hypothetical protein